MAKSAEAKAPSKDTVAISRNDLDHVHKMAQAVSLEANEISGILCLSSLVLREYHDAEDSVGQEMRYGVSLLLGLLHKTIDSNGSVDRLESGINKMVPSGA